MSRPSRSLLTIGRNIRRHRKTKGLSQEKLGFAARLDRTFISGIERGVRSYSIRSLIKIARALGVLAADLLHGVR
jgi:transcriptional regulator with XRE-family HTH domain